MANHPSNMADDPIVSGKGGTFGPDDMLKPSADVVHNENNEKEIQNTEFAADINHVAQLGFHNAAELEKKVVKALDTYMLPQMWILYMFNYLNRTNVAQARLNTFDEDLNLQDGDYQV